MNKVICFVDRQSIHRYYIFVGIIMNISNVTELGTGYPSFLLNLMMIYLRKAKTRFLCVACSEKFDYGMRFEKKGVFQRQTVSIIFCRS